MKSMIRIMSLIAVVFLISCSSQIQSSPTALPLSTRTPKPANSTFLPTMTPITSTEAPLTRIPLPPENHLYHGVYPGGNDVFDVTLNDLQEYERAVGKRATWVYFSAYWYESREFPLKIATWIRDEGSVPFIRMMLQSYFKFEEAEPVYTLDNILAGQFDRDLRLWCEAARSFGSPLLMEYGTEVNSDSYPWTGIANGGGQTDGYGDPNLPDGPERFQNAYRRIIQICRDAGAENITWVFHADSDSYPDEEWNKFENYYPGDEWIDWIGFSVYGTSRPNDPYYSIFHTSMENMYVRIQKLAPDKPFIVTEFGTAKNNPYLNQVDWTRDALEVITSSRYKKLIGFAWWNEAWQNDSNPDNDTSMRVQDNPDMQVLFQEMVGNNPAIIGQISK